MADTVTEIVIASTVLTSANSTITFSGIPNTYTDLRLVVFCPANKDAGVGMRLNSDTGTNYSRTQVEGNGTSAVTSRSTSSNAMVIGQENSANVTFHTADLFSYAGSTYKTVLATSSGDANGSGQVQQYVELWRNTNVISTITLMRFDGNNFAAGTIATLYGVL